MSLSFTSVVTALVGLTQSQYAPAPYPGGSVPAPYPGGATPSPYPGGSAPAPYPGGSVPAPYPGGATPSPYPGGSVPAPYPGGEGGATPSPYPGGSAPAPYPGGSVPAPYPGVPAPAPAPEPSSVTLYNYVGANAWWYAVAAVAPQEGVGVSSLMMRDSKMTQWEPGMWQYDYYCDCDAFQFYYNAPYTPPFSFMATLSNGQTVQGQNVINTFYDGDSGELSMSAMSGAFTADEAAARDTNSLSMEGLIVIVTVSILVCCLMVSLCFVCHRRKNKALKGGMEMDDEVIGGNINIMDEDMTTIVKGNGYDMTPIGDGNITSGNTGDDEQVIMVNTQITESVH